MSLPWNINASMGGASTNYQISRSLRFRSSASAYLNRTFSSSGTDLRKWTISFWMKRGALGVQSIPFGSQDTPGTGASSLYVILSSSNTIGVFYPNTGATLNVGTAAVLRDPSAWYHVVFAWDTTQATNTDRIKIYINGVQQTLSGGGTYPSLNATTSWNSNCAHFISKNPVSSADYFDGYLAEVYNIDGQALTPSSFGYYNPYTGVWQPHGYTGTYGTNGFYLPFTDIATTSGSNFGLGKDFSGNGNYFNTNNISVTAGTTYDSMIDSPTPFADGTAYGRGNYSVINPIAGYSTVTVSDGNLKASPTSNSGWQSKSGTLAVSSGKWYAEFSLPSITSGSQGNPVGVGLVPSNTEFTAIGQLVGDSGRGYGFYCSDTAGNVPNKRVAGTNTSVGAGTATTTSDVFMVAFDITNGNGWFGKNGTWYAGDPSAGTGASITGITAGSYNLGCSIYRDATFTNNTVAINFGQRPFTYTPPTGFRALNTNNLPTPTIPNGAAYMAATTYTGTGSALTVTNSGNNTLGVTFQPDFVWVKGRSGATSHNLSDVLRGTASTLFTNTTAAENTNTQRINAFNSNGFSVGTDTDVNTSSATYVGWQWKANGAGVSNTSGTITSTVSANTTAGFSVVTYTGNGTNGATIGHGLGVAPNMVLFKARNSAIGWDVYHSAVGNTAALTLNSTGAAFTSSTFFNNTSPSSTVITLGTDANLNGSGTTFVAYCFAAVSGYSAMGSYTGNGSTDGPFIYTGFRPRFVLLKNTSAVGSWGIYDSSRDTYNVETNALYPNLSSAETSFAALDFLSNGFKLRETAVGFNSSGATYIYAAFAENPFKYSLAR